MLHQLSTVKRRLLLLHNGWLPRLFRWKNSLPYFPNSARVNAMEKVGRSRNVFYQFLFQPFVFRTVKMPWAQEIEYCFINVLSACVSLTPSTRSFNTRLTKYRFWTLPVLSCIRGFLKERLTNWSRKSSLYRILDDGILVVSVIMTDILLPVMSPYVLMSRIRLSSIGRCHWLLDLSKTCVSFDRDWSNAITLTMPNRHESSE